MLMRALTLINSLMGTYVTAPLAQNSQVPLLQMQDVVTFSDEWHILGPFQIGTREATWGADPLEALGGFRSLEYDPKAEFRSSLTANGTVTWSRPELRETEDRRKVTLNVSFPNINWTSLQAVYGWAALQYQAWARGSATVKGTHTQTLTLYSDHVLEFWLDNEPHFGGDYYAYRNAPLVLHLKPGEHRLDVRLIRDIRVMGAVSQPTIEVELELKHSSGQVVVADKVLISDVVDGKLASPYGSVVVRNDGLVPVEVTLSDSPAGSPSVVPISEAPLLLAPGQTRLMSFRMTSYNTNLPLISFWLFYQAISGGPRFDTIAVRFPLTKVSKTEAHLITFLHPAGIVSYAILRPPPLNAVAAAGARKALPILLHLHGAGLEASSELVRHSLDEVKDVPAWILYPSGVTPWSGDDWHSWGFADVESAVAAIPGWIDAVAWAGPGVQTNKWLVSGHSNGGQGAWYALTHRPDKVTAAAPVSGYASIQSYVPYHLWQEVDPQKSALVQASMNSFRHEVLLENAKGIPILLQHGSEDDNVPPYQSRHMHQLASKAGAVSEYFEILGAGHWFDGVMTTQPLRRFYNKSLQNSMGSLAPLCNFSVVSANPGDTGPKFGLVIEQLIDPGRYGRIDVSISPLNNVISYKTTNVRSFRSVTPADHIVAALTINGQNLVRDDAPPSGKPLVVVVSEKSTGSIRSEVGELGKGHTGTERRGRQFGGLNAVLQTHERFLIVAASTDSMKVAVQISRNLFQYFKADAVITNDPTEIRKQPGNVLTIATGPYLPVCSLLQFPVRLLSSQNLAIRDDSGRERIYDDEDGLSAIFLRPLDGERVELVVWGTDANALNVAARLVPMLTGVGQPDFIVLRKSCLCTGVDGVLAMGFFDYFWNVSKSSYFS